MDAPAISTELLELLLLILQTDGLLLGHVLVYGLHHNWLLLRWHQHHGLVADCMKIKVRQRSLRGRGVFVCSLTLVVVSLLLGAGVGTTSHC